MSINPERIAEIRLALQDLGRGIHRYDLDLRGNGVASLVTELLDDAQRYETAYEHQVAEVKRLREQVANIVRTIKDMGANVHDNPCADILTLAKTAEERLDYIKRTDILKNEDRKARAHLASLLDLPMPPGAEPPGWTTILDTVSSAAFQLGEARKEIDRLTSALDIAQSQADSRWTDLEACRAQIQQDLAKMLVQKEENGRLTPRWQKGPPPAGEWVWCDFGGGDGAIVQTHGNPACPRYRVGPSDRWWDWGTARWAPIPKPTEG